MIQRVLLDSFLFFDIETAGLYPTLQEAKKEDPHLAELWVKRCKWLQKQVDTSESTDPSDLWLTKSSLHPEFGRVVCVSFGVLTPEGIERITSFYGEDEKDILELGWKEIIKNPQNIVAVEWPEKIKKVLPKNCILINFDFVDEKTREISFRV